MLSVFVFAKNHGQSKVNKLSGKQVTIKQEIIILDIFMHNIRDAMNKLQGG